MKKIIIALAMMTTLSTASAKQNCYENLLNGRVDSVVHQISMYDVLDNISVKNLSRIGLKRLLTRCGCNTKLRKLQCGEAISGNKLTTVCYVEYEMGYFLINRDFLDNLNIIFNRWD